MRDGAEAAWGAPPGGSHNPAAANTTRIGPANACQVNRRRQSDWSGAAPSFSAASSTTRDSSGGTCSRGSSRGRNRISHAVSTRSWSSIPSSTCLSERMKACSRQGRSRNTPTANAAKTTGANHRRPASTGSRARASTNAAAADAV